MRPRTDRVRRSLEETECDAGHAVSTRRTSQPYGYRHGRRADTNRDDRR